ncbi:MAG: hypothetical protein GOP50_05940 [Candidatus Heimdallarchaeota archaeon]|nr:hypothetical protein [Candidatus Heimdallarchaeota archaeon]
MNARARIFLIFFMSIGIIFLIIAIVQHQALYYDSFSLFSEAKLKDFLDVYVSGIPKPW